MDTLEPTPPQASSPLSQAAHFEALFAGSPTGAAFIGPLPELLLVWANPALARLLEEGRASLVGRPALAALPGLRDARALFERVEARRHAVRSICGDLERIGADGRRCTYLLSLDPVLDPQGGFRGFLLFARPVEDEESGLLQSLRDSEARYRSLFEQTLEPILQTAPEGRILSANPAATRLFGYSEEELQRLGRAAVVDPADPRLAPTITERERTGRVFTRLTLKRKDGSRFEAELSSSVFELGGERRTAMFIRDLTERERLAAELARQQRLLHAIVENIPVGVAVARGPDLRYELANPAFRSLASGRQVEGRSVLEVWREAADPFLSLLRRVVETGEPFHADDRAVQVRSPTGGSDERFFSFDFFRLSSPQEQGGEVLTLVTETTAQVRARRRLERLAAGVMALNARQRLPEILDSIVAGARELLGGDDVSVWLADEQERHLRGAQEYRPVGRVGAVIDLEQWPNNLRGIRERRTLFLTRAETAGRETEWFERMGMWGTLNVPLVVGERCLGMMYVNFEQPEHRPSAEDVEFAETLAGQCAQAIDRARVREEAEAAKAEAEHSLVQLEAVVDAISDGLAIWDREANLLAANRAATRMITSVGLDPAKLREGLESLDLRGPDGRPVSPSARPIFRVLHGEPYCNEELRIGAGAGAGRVFSVSGTAVRDPAGEVILAVNTFREITGQKADEAERERLLAEVGRRAAQLEQFISIVSHDLRTPMTTVQANAHMLRRAPDDPGNVARRSEAILVATQRMDRMMRDLVEATRLEAGQISLETEPLDLASFALELKERLVGSVDTGRLEIELPEVPSPALADPDRLERIFTNLLTNALKYSEGDVVVRFAVGDEEVEVSVCDRGPGIEPAELPRLFEWGYRSGRSRAAEGLGLGLYITRMLVEAHGGRIWAESEPGQGSTFRFTLPRVR